MCEGLGQVCEKVWGSVEGLGAQRMGRSMKVFGVKGRKGWVGCLMGRGNM